LFENVVSSVAGKDGKKSAARKAAAYLLLNQIVFYHVMSKEGYVTEIDEKKLKVPTQLFTEYFRQSPIPLTITPYLTLMSPHFFQKKQINSL
jgi:hypothetical protein